MEAEDFSRLTNPAVLGNIMQIKTYSINFQHFIHHKANMILTHLALLDVKLRERDLLLKEIENVANHPGNPSTNLGNNFPFRERLESLINEGASIHSNFDLAYDNLCSILQLETDFVKRNENNFEDSKGIVHPPIDNQYYPQNYYQPTQPTGVRRVGPNLNHISNQKYNRINNAVNFVDDNYNLAINHVHRRRRALDDHDLRAAKNHKINKFLPPLAQKILMKENASGNMSPRHHSLSNKQPVHLEHSRAHEKGHKGHSGPTKRSKHSQKFEEPAVTQLDNFGPGQLVGQPI